MGAGTLSVRCASGTARLLAGRGGLVRCAVILSRNTRIQHTASSGRRTLLTLSHAYGPTEPPLLPHTIPQHFSSIVSAHGDRLAVISRAQNNTRLTYRELDERSNALALGLRERDVGKGDRVGVMLGNNWEFAAVTYAVWKLGGILVPLNPAFNAKQVISALTHLEASHLIIGTETNLPYKAPKENISLLRQIVPNLSSSSGKVESPSVPSLRDIILVDNSSSRIDPSPYTATTPFSSLLQGFGSQKGRKVVPDSELKTDDIINIQFTSGTTSSPKAACLTHTGILNNGYFIGSRMGLTPEDLVCCPPPLFHCFGSILGYMATATHGSCILFPSEAFSPLNTMLAVQENKATALYGVATMFIACLELLSNKTIEYKGFEHLRTGIAAGSSVPNSLMSKLHKTLNLTGLTICYGMTETSPVSCMTTPNDPIQKRLDSVGRLLPHVEAKVVSSFDRNQILPVGQRGELVVSGYSVMKGYWGDKVRTDEVRTVEICEDGKEKVWMHTGDEAVMDEQGYVKITGRIKDLIIRGGENIHPLEVENCLLGMGQVKDASVVGVPDERLGEVVSVFVIAHANTRLGKDDAGEGEEGLDEIRGEDGGTGDGKEEKEGKGGEGQVLTREMVRNWVREHLSHHLVPKYVFWVDDYPKTASGKIQKFKLREMGVGMLARKKASNVEGGEIGDG